MVKIATNRFGTLEVAPSAWIEIKGSILGFEGFHRFVLLIPDEGTPLCWLQSLEDPALAFVVVNPLVVKPDYQPVFQERDLDFLGIVKQEEMVLLSIVTVRANPLRITANLRAPLVINGSTRQASQVILEDGRHPVQFEVWDRPEEPVADPAGRRREAEALSRLAISIPAL